MGSRDVFVTCLWGGGGMINDHVCSRELTLAEFDLAGQNQFKLERQTSIADPNPIRDPGSGIRCLVDHWIRDPE
jgi:hypothetical protein